jgi:hypothetical protein
MWLSGSGAGWGGDFGLEWVTVPAWERDGKRGSRFIRRLCHRAMLVTLVMPSEAVPKHEHVLEQPQ